MADECLIEPAPDAAPITALREAELEHWCSTQNPELRDWVQRCGFTALAGTYIQLPGALPRVLFGIGERISRFSFAELPHLLPAGDYRLDSQLHPEQATVAALGWATGAYRFNRYQPLAQPPARLCWPAGADRRVVTRNTDAIARVRDWVNTPASDMGPAELALIAEQLAQRWNATCRTTLGDDLLTANYPLIHAVGRASSRAPRLIDLTWGAATAPKVTLVGKGVCFDSGGLDLKQPAKMVSMKLDMAGAAHALALAGMIMDAQLPIRLRVLIPAVENSVGGNALRPSDIVRSRKGTTIEVTDTDAEGRLILADAIAEASSERPRLLVDFGTLTSSARAALGPDITAMFTNDDELASRLATLAELTEEPLWRMPLWRPYARDLVGKVAELSNVADLNVGPAPMGDAIHAALFLEHFVATDIPWIHLDLFGWNQRNRPGRPEGGEACNLLTVFELVASQWPAQQRDDPSESSSDRSPTVRSQE